MVSCEQLQYRVQSVFSALMSASMLGFEFGTLFWDSKADGLGPRFLRLGGP